MTRSAWAAANVLLLAAACPPTQCLATPPSRVPRRRWFADHAPAGIITSERIDPADGPDGVVVFRHLPDGCCHNDVPVFLAARQRGSSVSYLRAGGRRANAPAFVELISAYDQEG